MPEIMVPDAFTERPFYKKGDTVPLLKPWYEKNHPFPFMEDINGLRPPEGKQALNAFYNLYHTGDSLKNEPVLWTARYIQLFHWMEGKLVKSVKEAAPGAAAHPAAPWNSEDRLLFVLEDPAHFSRQITLSALIKEAGPKLQIYYNMSVDTRA
ncbi:MAG: hypothetical protein EA344_09440 [Alkalicoccus sp.]|nr:MAG: hypothetical protein EA344_09440 [Alkalicoccus sp.]